MARINPNQNAGGAAETSGTQNRDVNVALERATSGRKSERFHAEIQGPENRARQMYMDYFKNQISNRKKAGFEQAPSQREWEKKMESHIAARRSPVKKS